MATQSIVFPLDARQSFAITAEACSRLERENAELRELVGLQAEQMARLENTIVALRGTATTKAF